MTDTPSQSGGTPGGDPSATATGPSGLLILDKPVGPSSMHMCRIVRARLRSGGAPKKIKVGHGGTLDPLASGLMVILVGRATKLCDVVMAGTKGYRTTIDLSQTSTTDDAEGERTINALPLVDGIPTPPSAEQVHAALPTFTGDIQQRPPAYSAIKVGGRRAYALARAGQAPVLAHRTVTIHGLGVVSYTWPELVLDVTCGKGTYIRSLGRDIGASLGVGGMLTNLRRTRVGNFDIADAITLDELPDSLGAADLRPVPDLDDF